eukprot:7385809-Prymnesium_polylepis.4
MAACDKFVLDMASEGGFSTACKTCGRPKDEHKFQSGAPGRRSRPAAPTGAHENTVIRKKLDELTMAMETTSIPRLTEAIRNAENLVDPPRDRLCEAKKHEAKLAREELEAAMLGSAVLRVDVRNAIAAAREIHTPPEKAIEAAELRLTQLADTVLQKA